MVFREHNPQDDIDQFSDAHQAEDREAEPDEPGGQPETSGEGRADACDDFAVPGSCECASHAGDSTPLMRRREPAEL